MKREERELVTGKIVQSLESFINDVPSSSERKTKNPVTRSKKIGNTAAVKAAIVSGSLSIPPGPIGIITILPDLIAVWKIQEQMVADIAGAFGKKAYLGKEQMLYCLFKHAVGQGLRDLVVRFGERFLVKRVSFDVMERILQRIGLKVMHRITGKVVSRWIPIVGALGMGAYAYYDTAKVAETTISFFSKDIRVARQGQRGKKNPLRQRTIRQ